MAVVNANYEFTYVDIGCQGRISDGGVFRNTSFYDKLSKDQLMLPADEPVIRDDAFALTTRMLKPYPGVYNKGTQERIFNFRLSRARRVVENVFGILSSIFRIFKKPILLEPLRVTEITMTCVLLHNSLRKSRTSRSRYMPHESLDSEVEGLLIPGTWRNEKNMTFFLPLKKVARKPAQDGKIMRFLRSIFCNDRSRILAKQSVEIYFNINQVSISDTILFMYSPVYCFFLNLKEKCLFVL
nr:unnamed protein product [Callosobruchus analis]